MATYREETDLKFEKMTDDLFEMFPPFLSDYRRKLRSSQGRTQYGYAQDMKTFLFFLKTSNPAWANYNYSDFTAEDFMSLTLLDIEEYRDFLASYTDEKGKTRTNGISSVRRKIASLRSFFNYYVNVLERFPKNPVLNLELKKIPRKNIVYINEMEIYDLFEYLEKLDIELENGKKDHKMAYYAKTRFRDAALLMVLLGTGIRVSECAGLDLSHIDFYEKNLKVVRKGADEDRVYFKKDVETALHHYIDIERFAMEKKIKEHDKNALFISMQGSRMSIKSIERVVAKYLDELLPSRGISCHKLRSSYATEVLRKTKDVYSLSKALGHSSVAMVNRYAQESLQGKIDAADAMSFFRQK